MEIDAQRDLWKRRIREIQYLSCVVVVYFGMSYERSVSSPTLTADSRAMPIPWQTRCSADCPVNAKVAVLALCYLIYSTFARELENMLAAPTSMDAVCAYIDRMTNGAPKNQASPFRSLHRDTARSRDGSLLPRVLSRASWDQLITLSPHPRGTSRNVDPQAA
jgi:hypothetical protein